MITTHALSIQMFIVFNNCFSGYYQRFYSTHQNKIKSVNNSGLWQSIEGSPGHWREILKEMTKTDR